MAYIEYTNPELRIWLQYDGGASYLNSNGSGRIGRAERSVSVLNSDETLLRFDISDLLFSTIIDAALEFTANSQGSQSGSGTLELFNQNDINNFYWEGSNPYYAFFTISAWTAFLSSVSVFNTGTYTIPNTTAFKNLMQDWVDWGINMNGIVMGINWATLNDYLSIDSVKLKLNYTPPVNPVWGMKYTLIQSAGILSTRMIGGTSPDIDNMTIESISFAVGPNKSENIRLAVYTGGLLTSPVGATLLYDFGQISGSGGNKWYTINHPSGGVSWPKNTITWLAWKADGGTTDLIYTEYSSRSGNTQNSRGRWQSTAMSFDETVSYESTVPSGGSFSNFWTPIVIQYSTPIVSGIRDNAIIRGVNRGIYRGIL